MSMSEVQSLVDELARDLRAPVLLTDVPGATLVYSPGQQDQDETRTASILRRMAPEAVMDWVREMGVLEAREPMRVRLPPDIARRHLERVAVPAWYGSRRMGTLWIIDDDQRLGVTELARAMSAGQQTALLLHEQEFVRRTRSELLDHLLSPVPGLRQEAGAQLALQAGCGAYALIVLRPVSQPPAPLQQLVMTAELGRIGQFVLIRDTHVVLLLVCPAEGSEEQAVSATLIGLERVGGFGTRWVAGVSERRHRLEEAPSMYRQALLACRTAVDDEVPAGRVRYWGRLGALRVLAEVGPESWEDVFDPRVRPLLSPELGEVRRTVEAFLDAAGDVRRTAEAVNVHRGTVYYRLRQVAEMTSLDLDDGMDRLALHMSLKLAAVWSARP